MPIGFLSLYESRNWVFKLSAKYVTLLIQAIQQTYLPILDTFGSSNNDGECNKSKSLLRRVRGSRMVTRGYSNYSESHPASTLTMDMYTSFTRES